MGHLKTMSIDAWNYFWVALTTVKPILAVVISAFSFIMFPNSAMLAYAGTLTLTVGFDILTKFYAITKSNDGIINAFKFGRWNSNSFWVGSRKKIIDIGVIFIICGLTVRFSNGIEIAGLAFTTFAYSVMMLREIQSVCENMIEAGHESFQVYVGWIKRKKKEVVGEFEKEEDTQAQG